MNSSRLSALLVLLKNGRRFMTTGTRQSPVRIQNKVSLILRKQLDDLGYLGQEVQVSPGYARNYLIPHKLAVYATEANRRSLRVDLPDDIRAEKDAERALNRLKTRVANIVLTFKRATSDGKSLYGAITASDVVEGLQQTVLKNLKIAEVNVRIPRSITETEEKIVTIEDGKEATSVDVNTAVSAPAVGGIKGGNVLQTVGSFIVQIEPAKVGYSGEWMDLKVEVMSA
jgi:large subunit ribosomal protein L9